MNRRALIKFILVIAIIQPLAGETEGGKASWYGGRFHGRQTASGEIFDTNKLTAAHKTLPFGTMVTVTNLNNNMSVTVRINDRGPFVESRIIDLSKAAAVKLDMLKEGVIPVEITWNTGEDDTVNREEEETSSKDRSGKSYTAGNYTIQAGAFRDFKNVIKLKEKIRKIGLEPYSTMNNEGLIRVLIVDIPPDKTYKIVQDLKEIGIESITVKQN